MKDPVLTVSQITTYIRSLMDGDLHLQNVYLCGEISNFTDHIRSGHWYFSLKDEESVLKCVMFRSANQRLRFRPENGMRVIVRGRITVYERDGAYQLYTEDMQPDGAGALAVAFEQLRRKLQAEGLFDESRKQSLPRFPSVIGVITSPTGAARRDIETVLARRFPLAEIRLVPVLVQGMGAPAQLAAALDRLNQCDDVDVIIIGRGGGSVEELWAFNDERTVRAVARSEIPVISAVGHETDFTLCDFAADCRAPTPSAAAELAVPDASALSARLVQLRERLQSGVMQTVSAGEQRFRNICARAVWQHPPVLTVGAARAEQLRERLFRAAAHHLQTREMQFGQRCAQLHALCPLNVLSRGYAAVYADRWVSNARALTVGQQICVQFQDGQADCTVCRVELRPSEGELPHGEERNV